jgi:hypothetical protein
MVQCDAAAAGLMYEMRSEKRDAVFVSVVAVHVILLGLFGLPCLCMSWVAASKRYGVRYWLCQNVSFYITPSTAIWNGKRVPLIFRHGAMVDCS